VSVERQSHDNRTGTEEAFIHFEFKSLFFTSWLHVNKCMQNASVQCEDEDDHHISQNEE